MKKMIYACFMIFTSSISLAILSLGSSNNDLWIAILNGVMMTMFMIGFLLSMSDMFLELKKKIKKNKN
ncbi:MAG: hypothetical protein FWE36_03885 [Erysipelotrichales bacterium]|nr:hypothetical protein [Erysipelotrichales bacterium]